MHYVLIKDETDQVKVKIWGAPNPMYRLFGFIEIRAGLAIAERVFTGEDPLTCAAVFVEMLDKHGVRAAGNPIVFEKLADLYRTPREACLFNPSPLLNEERLTREMDYAEIRGFIWTEYGEDDEDNRTSWRD